MNEELFQVLSANARRYCAGPGVRDQVQPLRSFQDEVSEDEVFETGWCTNLCVDGAASR